MVNDRIYVFSPTFMVRTKNNFNHLYIIYLIYIYSQIKIDLVCGAEAPWNRPYGLFFVWTPYMQYLLMVALAYISRNRLIDWIINIQSNLLITNFPASVPKYLLDGNHYQTKHWPINEDQSNPIQISCTREYPGNDIRD